MSDYPHHYSCEFSVSLDAAIRKLDSVPVSYRVISEVTLALRSPPSDNVKTILAGCGFWEDPYE